MPTGIALVRQRLDARLAVLLLVVLACLALPVESSVSCDCYEGSIQTSSPCTCTCASGYLQPFCAFTSTDMAKVELVVNVSLSNISQWSASLLEYAIKDLYNVPRGSSNIQFQIQDTSSNDFTRTYPTLICSRWLMLGSIATLFLQDNEAKSVKLSNLGIVNADMYKPDPAAPGEASDGILFNVGPGSIGVLFPVLFVIVLIIAVIECCVVSNTTERCEELQRRDMERLGMMAAAAAAGAVVVGAAVVAVAGEGGKMLDSTFGQQQGQSPALQMSPMYDPNPNAQAKYLDQTPMEQEPVPGAVQHPL